MSLTRELTIWCDGCAHWDQRSDEGVPSFRRELRRIGWSTRRIDGELKDFCPTCTKKKDDSQQSSSEEDNEAED